MMTSAELTAAVRDAAMWSKKMNDAVLDAQQSANQQATEPPSLWERMSQQSSKMADLTIMITAIRESKRKLQAVYDTLVEKAKNQKGCYIGQKRTSTGAIKEKSTYERGIKLLIAEKEHGIEGVKKEIQRLQLDLNLAEVNKCQEMKTSCEAKIKELETKKKDLKQQINAARERAESNIPMLKEKARVADRNLTRRKVFWDEAEDEVTLAGDALEKLKNSEASGQAAVALMNSMLVFLAKKMAGSVYYINAVADVDSFACLAVLPAHILKELDGSSIRFSIGSKLEKEHYPYIQKQMSLVSNGVISVVPGVYYEMYVHKDRCFFRKVW